MRKVDTSLYWDDWSADIAMVADRYIHSFAHLLEDAEPGSVPGVRRDAAPDLESVGG